MHRRWMLFVLGAVLIAGILLPVRALPQDQVKKNGCLDKDVAEPLIDHRFDDVRSEIQNVLLESGLPSISVAVAKSGKIIWEESFGWANREKMIKATPNTLYSLASISKPITATGLMILVEQKLVEPDGDVHVRIKDQLETLLNRIQFKDDILSGVCPGEIQTDDAKLFPHVIQFGMGLKGEKLDGFVSAIALKWYALSSWIHLDKKK